MVHILVPPIGKPSPSQPTHTRIVMLWFLVIFEISVPAGPARSRRSSTAIRRTKHILMPPLRKPNPNPQKSHMAHIVQSDAIAIDNETQFALFLMLPVIEAETMTSEMDGTWNFIGHDTFFGETCRFWRKSIVFYGTGNFWSALTQNMREAPYIRFRDVRAWY